MHLKLRCVFCLFYTRITLFISLTMFNFLTCAVRIEAFYLLSVVPYQRVCCVSNDYHIHCNECFR